MTASLQGLCNYLLELYTQISTPAALQLVDEFVQLMKPDREDAANEEAVRAAMTRALLGEDRTSPGGVEEFVATVQGFLVSMGRVPVARSIARRPLARPLHVNQ